MIEDFLRLLEKEPDPQKRKTALSRFGQAADRHIRNELDLARIVHNTFFSGIYAAPFHDPTGMFHEENEHLREQITKELRPSFHSPETTCIFCGQSPLELDNLCKICADRI